ncbi:MAG: class I SAM-dependent methyltransferase [Planctomycetota bacterium]
MSTQTKCENLIKRYYQGVVFRDSALHKGISKHIFPGAVVLDAGCGHDAPIASQYVEKASLCAGVDLVERFDAPREVRVVRADLNKLPFVDRTFDLAFSRSVLEHLPEPARTFREFSRVLKKGGKLILVTPNKYDYASIFARMIPNRFHGMFLRNTVGEDVYDNFPTHFRCNTRSSILKALEGTDLQLQKIEYLRHYPYYLMFSVPLFYLGMAYDRMITAMKMGFLQPSIYVEIRKSQVPA